MFGRKSDGTADLEFFAVYDSKIGKYEAPLIAVNALDLQREILNIFRDPQRAPQNKYWLNAEDYILFRVGQFDRSSGKIAAIAPEHVVNFHELKFMARPTQDEAGPVGIAAT